MLPSKDLNLPAPRTHPLNESIYLIRLPARLPHLRHDHIGIQPAIYPGGELERAGFVDHGLYAHKHVFFGVVQPVACAACANHTLQLKGFGENGIRNEDNALNYEIRLPGLF